MTIARSLGAVAICLAVPAHAQPITAPLPPVTAQAQTGTIAGLVIDDRTEQPIKGVAIYVESQSIVAETDTNGRFSLSVPRGRQTIAASVIGYALLRTEVEVAAAPLEMTIRLSEGAGAYTERVTVSGSLRRESDSVPGGTSLYGRELETLRGAVLDDPMRAIQSLPSATATDDFYSEFAVRGNPFRYVGLVVDGVPTRYLMHAVNMQRRRVDRHDQQRDAGQRVSAPGKLSPAHRPPTRRRSRSRHPGGQSRRVPRAGRLERDERERPRRGSNRQRERIVARLGPPQLSRLSDQADRSRDRIRLRLRRCAGQGGLRLQSSPSGIDHGAPRSRGVRGRRSGARRQRDSDRHQPRLAVVAVVAIPAEPAVGRHATAVLDRSALRQRQQRRGGARRRAVHQARMARRRIVDGGDARGGRIWRRRRASRRPRPHRQADLGDERPGGAQRLRRGGNGRFRVRTGAARGSPASERDSRRPYRPLEPDGIDGRLPVGQRRVACVGGHASAWRQRHLSSVRRSRPGVRHSRRWTRPAAGTRAAPRCRYRAGAGPSDAGSVQCLLASGTGRVVDPGGGAAALVDGHDPPGRVQRTVGQRSARRGAWRRGRSASRRGGRIFRIRRLRLQPPEIHGHRDRRKLLGRCGSAAHGVAVRQLSPLEPDQRQRPLPIRVELSDHRVHWRTVGRPGPAAAHRSPAVVLRALDRTQ